MDEETSVAFRNFWDKVGDTEHLIRDWTGPLPASPACLEEFDDEWIGLYRAIETALHPLVARRLFHFPPEAPGQCVFEAETAHEALRFFLDSYQALVSVRSVLESDEYVQVKREAQSELQHVQSTSEETNSPVTLSTKAVKDAVEFSDLKPKWDSDRRELAYGKNVCKKYRQKAPRQIPILEKFEEMGWPARIMDSLGDREKTRFAVRELNKNDYIEFELTGDGEGILWKPR